MHGINQRWSACDFLCFLAAGTVLAWPSALIAQVPAGDRQATGVEELQKTASWDWPDVAAYEELLASYLEQQGSSEAIQQQVMEFWRATAARRRGPDFLDRLLQTAAIVEPRIAQINAQLNSTTGEIVQPQDLAWLTSDVPGWLQDAVRLACGRALAQRRLVDEALAAMAGLEVSQVCDPSSLLFYRASSSHQLLKRDECLADAQTLLERAAEIPTRYAQVARLMRADIETLEADSLDEVARMMFDVQRRLVLGRAGQVVRDQEQEIVDKLDKMIEQMEQQIKQQRQRQQAANQGKAPNAGQTQPMEESQAAGGLGAGDVDKKEIGERANWGNLPPAQRQESLQRLTEELPSHYRDVIEGYFRQLAKDRS